VEASSASERGGYLRVGRLTPAELGGCIAGIVLVGSLFLPWFATSETNDNSSLAGASGGETVTAFEVFPVLKWLLVAAAVAPFILSWIVARGHKLTWKPGEVTMVVGVTAFVLVLCNGIVLGKPEETQGPNVGQSIEISLQLGYLVALVAALALAGFGFLRQAHYTAGRKPPGVI